MTTVLRDWLFWAYFLLGVTVNSAVVFVTGVDSVLFWVNALVFISCLVVLTYDLARPTIRFTSRHRSPVRTH